VAVSKRHSSLRLMVLLMFAMGHGKIFSGIRIVFLELGKQTLIGESRGMRVCPVLLERLVDATDDGFIPGLDGKFTAPRLPRGNEAHYCH
jgi:hypothetical protein